MYPALKEGAYMTATITKWGNSKGVRIPKVFLDALGLQENDKVDVSILNDTITMKKSTNVKRKAHKTIEQRFEEFYGTDFETAVRDNPYDFPLIDWGEPVGDEVW